MNYTSNPNYPDNPDVIIVGGGAAGCAAAIFAAERGERALVIERGEKTMRKLLITGKGRCNLTNNSDVETILRNVKTNPRFMQSALNRFGSADVMAFFENLGVKLKTERGNRVFPVSDRAADVVEALNSRMKKLGVSVINERAKSLIVRENVLIGVKCEKSSYFAPKLILATGGLSYPKTGSTGDGYKLAAACGHNIIAPKPSLVPVITREDVSELSGLTLKNVKLSLFPSCSRSCSSKNTRKPLYSEQGELLFTHFGISGPLALSASFFIADSEYKILIDLKPALDEKKLDARLLREFSANKNKRLQNALISAKLFPKAIIPFVISEANMLLSIIFENNITPLGDVRVNEVIAEGRKCLVSAIKNLPLTFAAFRPIEEAVITDGGIDVREINPKNMESKLVKGLRFAGEVIDVAAFTGGFNLQIAFSTAYAAANGE